MSNDRIGEKNHQWKGGLSPIPYSMGWTKALKKRIKERDHDLCQICYQKGTDIHHIDYVKCHHDPENLITLCHSCHSKTNHNRESWAFMFVDTMTFGNLEV